MRLASLAVCLLWASWAHATWSMVGRTASTCTASTQTCTSTFSLSDGTGSYTTVAGDIVIAFAGTSGSGVIDPLTLITDTAGSTYTIPSGCVAFESTVALTTISCGYTLNAHAGATSITATRTSSAASTWQLRAIIWRSSVGNVALDGIAASTDTTVNTNPTGPTMPITTAYNHVVMQALRGGGSAIALPYTFVTGWGTTTIGWAINLNAAVPAQWTQTAGRATMAAIAIAEGTAGAVTRQPRVDVITENRHAQAHPAAP